MAEPRKPIHLPKVRMLRPVLNRVASGIRITNVKSIKPPDPETLKKQEEDQLRAQLQREIVSRSRICANKSYECTLPVLAGRSYCFMHILKDPTAPYKQCTHSCSGGERCQQPTPIDQKDVRDLGLCFEHAITSYKVRQRSLAPPPPVTTPETLLNQLQHYVKPERPRTISCTSSVSVVSDQGEQEAGVPNAVDPFKQIDATAVNSQYSGSILDCASASDSDGDSVVLGPDGDCRGGCDEELSDYEEAPQETEPLWRAGVFTAEEAVREAKTALISLQDAYLRQMERLRTLLQMSRGQYIKTVKAEREQFCSIHYQAVNYPLTIRERRQLRKLKAFASYRKKHGVDAVLARKLHHKRAKQGVESSNRGGWNQGRCIFTEGGVRCSKHTLPAAKHCLTHILHDKNQVLFEPCGDERGCSGCGAPAARVPLPAGAACRYHVRPPHYATLHQRNQSDEDESDSHSSTDESTLEEITEPASIERPEATESQDSFE